jgi:hypothetical protein
MGQPPHGADFPSSTSRRVRPETHSSHTPTPHTPHRSPVLNAGNYMQGPASLEVAVVREADVPPVHGWQLSSDVYGNSNPDVVHGCVCVCL